MLQQFKKAATPGWDGQIKPQQAVHMMLSVVDKLTIEQSGDFVSHYGNKNWL
jgi:hypothetical protein